MDRARPGLTAGRFVGKVAVVTGGARGIGSAMARRFSAEGAHVVVADVAEEAGSSVAESVGGTFLRTDVTDAESVAALYDQTVERLGRVDVCCNNAGISPPEDGSILDTPLAVWQQVTEVNLTSVYLCCRQAIPWLIRQGGGAVVNVASFVALMGSATSQISYTASKGGVLALTRELGVQFARRGVRVNALCPGPVDTALLRGLFAADPAQAARRLAHVPMGRFAQPEEVAAAAAFLASDDASFVTASALMVDGGIHAAYVTAE